MKNKLTLLALACGLSFAANAQVAEQETLKPVTGNKTLEATLNFFGGASTQIKLRKFTSEQKAVRYTAGISYDYDKLADDASSSSLTISFAPGFEKHFAGTNRLSPYLGFAVPISLTGSKFESEYSEIKGATSEHGYDRSKFSIGVDGLAGVDFYVAKNFYIGFEAGVGLAYRKYSDVEVKYKSDFTRNSNMDGYNGINFSTFTTGGLRIGFAF
ncbi:hypothetical protein [uncultured Pontibacter sp.]|uniref:hypothetical protein n=1 Tax=uncultured Pontibacter sp. TaxID=453356 RepID=UPI00260BE83C|nr:hypothetical protein [uncultured Pontibacter sp.]